MEHGIVHRDLKSANVIVLGDGAVKVLDFGLRETRGRRLRRPHQTRTGKAMTQPGVVLGTPGYMAPKGPAGHPADGKADIWALWP